MQRWESPTSFASNGWKINETNWKCKARNQVQETPWTCYKWWNFSVKKEVKGERKTVFFPFLEMSLKPFLWGGFKTLLWQKFERVLPCFVTNMPKTSKQKMLKCAQNHFGEVSISAIYMQNLDKVAKWIILNELEYIRVKIRFETLNKLKLKCRNLYVKKEKIQIGHLFFKKWSNGASNRGIPLFNPKNLQFIIFSVHNY